VHQSASAVYNCPDVVADADIGIHGNTSGLVWLIMVIELTLPA